MDDRRQRLETAIRRRDRAKQEVQRIQGRLDSARAEVERVEAEIRAKKIDPDKIDEAIAKLNQKFDQTIQDIEQRLTTADKQLEPYREER